MSGVTVRVGLLLAPYAFIVFGLRARRRVWRAAAIDAATVWGVLAVLITELLSLADGLTPKNLGMSWSAVTDLLTWCHGVAF
jgi:hypothetical protein